jgi:hypothetical protein
MEGRIKRMNKGMAGAKGRPTFLCDLKCNQILWQR